MGSSVSRVPAACKMPPLPTYGGQRMQYKHLVFILGLSLNPNMGFEERSKAISEANIDKYIPHMADMYHQGYKMLLFFSVPNSEQGSHSVGGMAGSRQKTAKFQATFRKLLAEEEGEQWELQTDKTILTIQKFSQNASGITWNTKTQASSVTDSNQLVGRLNMITQRCGRLIAIELSQMGGQHATMQQGGQQQASGSVPQMQVPVDILYEVPRHVTSEQYAYQVVNCPLVSTSFQGRNITLWSSTIDWEGVMGRYLGTGWKLAEIFEDNSSVSTGTVGSFGNQKTKQNNCQWIFEKPVSRLHDNTPYYEGTKVECQFTVCVNIGFASCSANGQTNFEVLMDHYGANGWQAVRILRTPDTKTQQAFPPIVHQRYMMFLQRLILERDDTTCSMSGQAPPMDSKGPQGPFQASSQPFQENYASAHGSGPAGAPPSYDEIYTPKK